jgi:hypothetical protein
VGFVKCSAQRVRNVTTRKGIYPSSTRLIVNGNNKGLLVNNTRVNEIIRGKC